MHVRFKTATERSWLGGCAEGTTRDGGIIRMSSLMCHYVWFSPGDRATIPAPSMGVQSLLVREVGVPRITRDGYGTVIPSAGDRVQNQTADVLLTDVSVRLDVAAIAQCIGREFSVMVKLGQLRRSIEMLASVTAQQRVTSSVGLPTIPTHRGAESWSIVSSWRNTSVDCSYPTKPSTTGTALVMTTASKTSNCGAVAIRRVNESKIKSSSPLRRSGGTSRRRLCLSAEIG